MSSYNWRGIDWRGKELSGTCSADSAQLLHLALQQRGIEPLSIHRRLWPSPTRYREAQNPRKRSATLRRIAAVLEAGTRLDRALRIIAAQEPNPTLRNGLRDARHGVEHGHSITLALGNAMPGLSSTHLAILQAGERSGDIISALQGVADELDRQADLVAQLRRAATYPAVVASAATALITMMLLFVVPRFEVAFGQANQDLPIPTRLVMGAADIFAASLPVLIALLGITLAAALLYRRLYPHSNAAYDLLGRLPWSAGIVNDANMSRWYGTLSRLLGAGIALLEALPLASRTCKCTATAKSLEHIERAIGGGERFAPAVQLYLPQARSSAQLIAIGEESGRLGEMLGICANEHQQSLEQRIQRGAAVIEPALIVFMGIVTAGIVAALYLPIFQLGATIN
ncbi:type II secretion system F family protein [Halorhodospira halochloris]|uniref:General secretion pathway protein F n=1 Tax=Halorhodospira halochloris TaxID=1052 RepID=A0A110B620_HALHR|nr:type II secretion system F family protein [Halorhodospira halochloris]MBK1652145.1 hypothetical protein [Halorhodospira halochloris]MCG5530573.1 type II secretion system F family protein [Halorhodospira halochloris]MCG5547845.1 type II secretion system F family protein [Halorhodospira halochloris]BAU58437.1 general secretion pathway protein F [Halorhodospira halochloris]